MAVIVNVILLIGSSHIAAYLSRPLAPVQLSANFYTPDIGSFKITGILTLVRS